MQWILSYVAILIAGGVLDAAWITLVARKQYEIELSESMRSKPQLPAGILFYLIFSAGIALFAVLPMTRHFDGVHAVFATYRDVVGWGAALGFFAYSVFSLTNQAILKEWKYKIVIADILWGAVLSAAMTVAGFVVFRALA